jgi:hypothetical protein
VTSNVAMVSTAHYDEPIQEVVEVGRDLQDVDFCITGDFAFSLSPGCRRKRAAERSLYRLPAGRLFRMAENIDLGD